MFTEDLSVSEELATVVVPVSEIRRAPGKIPNPSTKELRAQELENVRSGFHVSIAGRQKIRRLQLGLNYLGGSLSANTAFDEVCRLYSRTPKTRENRESETGPSSDEEQRVTGSYKSYSSAVSLAHLIVLVGSIPTFLMISLRFFI